MPTYNGFLTSLIKGQSGGAVLTGLSYTTVAASVPAKHITNAMFGAVTSGISGAYAVQVVSSIGGCTYVVAGATGIATNGSTLFGSSTTVRGAARPAYVQFSSAEDASGFTATIYMAGEY
jgi:hypothetical protein